MDRELYLGVLEGYPAHTRVGDVYDKDAEFASALNWLYPQMFEYPDFSHKRVSDLIAQIESKDPKSEAAMAIAHRRVYKTIDDWDAYERDGVAQEGVLREGDVYAYALAGMGWTNLEISANAMGIGVEGHRQSVKDGWSSGLWGVPVDLRSRGLEERNPGLGFNKDCAGGDREKVDSYRQAMMIARDKGRYELVSSASERTYEGKVMADLEHHVVMSLGRSAAIFSKSMFDTVPALCAGKDACIEVIGGMAKVVPQVERSKELSR